MWTICGIPDFIHNKIMEYCHCGTYCDFIDSQWFLIQIGIFFAKNLLLMFKWDQTVTYTSLNKK